MFSGFKGKMGNNLGKILKNPLITYWQRSFRKSEVKKQGMNTKTKAAAILSLVAIAAVVGGLIYSMQSVKADSTTPVATDAETNSLSSINNTITSSSYFGFGNGQMAFGMEPRFGMGHRGGMGEFGPSAIQVSSDFTANVTNIAKNDSDVQNLLNQNYNITSVRPIISTSIDGNGNVVTKASTAELTLVGTNGRALVIVDLDQAKVTKIVTMTVTEIDK